MTDESNVSHWIEQVKQGNSMAADQVWHHYFDRLVKDVRRRLLGHNRAISDEEDIVLSVFDSFYAAAEKGRFPDLADRDDLWKLLLGMAAKKIVSKKRHDQRQKRGGAAKHLAIGVTSDREDEIHVIGNEPSPEMVLMMQESVEKFFSQLGVGQLRDLAVAKLEGYSNVELAERFGCSIRTIERRLHLIREKCQQELVDQNEHSPKEITDRSPGAD